MQTFLPYSDFALCATVLDYRRLGKQRVECETILSRLYYGPTQQLAITTDNKTVWVKPDGSFKALYDLFEVSELEDLVRKTPWYSHPAVQMWKGFEPALVEYSLAMCDEWAARGYSEGVSKSKILKLKEEFNGRVVYPSWIGDESLHASHRSNLLRKKPEFYKQYGWKESNDLPYVWPKPA